MNTLRITTRLSLCSFTLLAALASSACAEDPEAREFGLSPRSLEGTEIDGALRFDAQDRLVFDDDARLTFDYFLTSEGELSPAELDEWFARSLAELGEFSPAQSEQILSAWHGYVGYRSAAAATLASEAAMAAAGPGLASLRAELETEFGGSPFALAEAARLDRALALRAVYDVHGDDPQTRDVELARLDIAAKARFEQTRAGRFLAAREQVDAARLSGASAAQLHAARVEHFDVLSPGAAARLSALDAKRAAWAGRVETFELDRAQLRASWTGSEQELDASLAQLEAAAFNPAERRRIARP